MPSAATAYSALQGYQAPNATDVLNQANTQYNVSGDQTRVSDLQNSVNNLNTSLNAVDPSVTGRTSGTFTSEGQRAALVTKEQAPIQQNITSQNANLTQANDTLSKDTSSASTLASAIMAQNQTTYQKLLDQYNASAAYEKQQQDNANAAATLVATKASDQAKLNEQIREYNNPQPAKLTAAEAQTQATQQAVTQATQTLGTALGKVTGRDGYVSPNDYNAAKREWTAAGLPAASFDTQFAGYRNPGNPYYGVTQSNATTIYNTTGQ